MNVNCCETLIFLQIEKDLWEVECEILREKLLHEPQAAISFRFRVVDTLAAQDLTKQTPYRSFELVVCCIDLCTAIFFVVFQRKNK